MSDPAESAAEENTPEGAADVAEGEFEVEAHAESPLGLQEMSTNTPALDQVVGPWSATSLVLCS